jgi:hypothetical protein
MRPFLSGTLADALLASTLAGSPAAPAAGPPSKHRRSGNSPRSRGLSRNMEVVS